jgi:hypothetical protein
MPGLQEKKEERKNEQGSISTSQNSIVHNEYPGHKITDSLTTGQKKITIASAVKDLRDDELQKSQLYPTEKTQVNGGQPVSSVTKHPGDKSHPLKNDSNITVKPIRNEKNEIHDAYEKNFNGDDKKDSTITAQVKVDMAQKNVPRKSSTLKPGENISPLPLENGKLSEPNFSKTSTGQRLESDTEKKNTSILKRKDLVEKKAIIDSGDESKISKSKPENIFAGNKEQVQTITLKTSKLNSKQADKIFVHPAQPTANKEENLLNAARELSSRKIENIRTVEISQDSLIFTLYDNGAVDGDTVSILLNGTVIMPKVGLSEKSYNKTIYLTPEMGDSINIIMYAENLGSIPPNTGLLVVRDGAVNYEIRFSGDLKKNSSIILKRKNKL